MKTLTSPHSVSPPGSGFGPAKLAPAVFGVTVVWSACLLFLVEPLASKLILPWYGGSAAVWITCLLFFQTALLFGYLYAHALSSLLSARYQALVHAALLAVSAFTLPIVPNPRWQSAPGVDPTWSLLAVLSTSVGLPYLLLSSTSPLVQSWYARVRVGALPYRYFALSNAGSLVALLAYPVLLEPNLTTRAQAWSWSAAYLVFAVICVAAACLLYRSARFAIPQAVSSGESRRSPGLWIALSACPSALLLAVTGLLTENIAPMPLLWVLPLCLYLLTFILCFDSSRWYRRAVFLPLTLPALGCLAAATGPLRESAISLVVPLLCASLFVCCMACHGELVRLKPDAAGLTGFYVCLSAGGVLGGLFIALFSPHVFPARFDYPLTFIACAVLLLVLFWRERASWRGPYPLLFWTGGVAALLLLTAYLAQNTWRDLHKAVFLGRNFYGALRVEDVRDNAGMPVRALMHGTITHGIQYRDPRLRSTPTTYYTRQSGVGLAWQALERRGPIKAGIIGLGAGTMAAYGRAGDTLRFYEINPLVIEIARRQFSFLADTTAHVDLVQGDARLSLQHESRQNFDLLLVDAFAGDAIPLHLLTREALALYLRQLRPGGVLAFHVSNRYLDLPPVIAAGAREFGWTPFQVENDDNDRAEVYSSSYVLLTGSPAFFSDPAFRGKLISIKIPQFVKSWTDNFSNLWQVLKMNDNDE